MYDPKLPEDFQGMNDPGNDEPEVLLNDDGDPVDDEFLDDDYNENE